MTPEDFIQAAIDREKRKKARYALKHPRIGATLDEVTTADVRRAQAAETDRRLAMVPETVYVNWLVARAVQDRLDEQAEG